MAIETSDGVVISVDLRSAYRDEHRELMVALLEASRIWYGGGEALATVPKSLGPMTELVLGQRGAAAQDGGRAHHPSRSSTSKLLAVHSSTRHHRRRPKGGEAQSWGGPGFDPLSRQSSTRSSGRPNPGPILVAFHCCRLR